MDGTALPTFLSGDSAGIRQAAELLQAGQCVATPTETVYGLAGDAFNEAAVRSIFAIKNRPYIDPLIVHFHELSQLEQLTQLSAAQQTVVQQLSDAFWPGPLTMILPKQPEVSGLVTANRESVAVRQPAHPVMRELLKVSGLYLAAPSANPFGYISPTTAQHVRDSLKERCPHILDGGACISGVESTIIDIRKPDAPCLLRPGPIGAEELASVLDRPITKPTPQSDASLAPGMLERHYSPRTGLSLYNQGELPELAPGEARIFLKRPSPGISSQSRDYWFSETGALDEIAHCLFGLLRALDTDSEIERIHCEIPQPGPGVADAIRDRLTRASKR
ncbi:L-threonylcarbamoyladenylate synthase [Cerasicoccus frondis]|uniref:L-threonylcarbamoyladenylate synthase n=1 Tax=Cerasicoccus frondis TaxID=490090 RepID=UPI002852706B|nr:L-threonylcarbamoyladenylate synthase [Cerasicoccus frondis]